MKFNFIEVWSKIWNDSVWSKVISVAIISVFSILYISIKDLVFEYLLISFLIFIILILFFIIYLKNKEINSLNYFDRQYKFISIHNKFSINTEGSLDLEQNSIRKIKCLRGEINYFVFGPSSDVGIYKRSFESIPKLIKINSSNNNNLIYKSLNKNDGSSLKYRFNLLKPLFKNEIIEFEIQHKIKNFKIGNKNELIKYISDNKESFDRNHEYSSFSIGYPTEKFEYIMEFDYNCKIDSVELEVLINQNSDKKEYEKAIKKFSIENTKNSIIFSLKITNPKLKNKYRFKWIPPII